MIGGVYSQIPRTGSTAITALLQQRSDAYMPMNSPLIEFFWRAESLWGNPDFRMELSDPSIFYGREKIVQGMVNGFTESIAPQKLWIDKHWNWAAMLNYSTLKEYYPSLKMFRTVRDWNEIEESFNNTGYEYSKEKLQLIKRVQDSLILPDDMLLTIEFRSVENDLPSVMQNLEQFLGLPRFSYDFKTIEIDTSILDDLTSPNLHELRAAA